MWLLTLVSIIDNAGKIRSRCGSQYTPSQKVYGIISAATFLLKNEIKILNIVKMLKNKLWMGLKQNFGGNDKGTQSLGAGGNRTRYLFIFAALKVDT